MLFRASVESRTGADHHNATALVGRDPCYHGPASAPGDNSSLQDFWLSMPADTLGENGFKPFALLSLRKKSTDPNDLLKTLIFADLDNYPIRIFDLGQPVALVEKQGNVVFACRVRGPRNLYDRAPGKSKWSYLVGWTGREQSAGEEGCQQSGRDHLQDPL